MAVAKVYLDPGHGGRDPGAVANGLQEKVLTLKIAQYARTHLLNNYKDVQVKMSRTTDKYLSLPARTNDANKWGADVLASIHINAAGSTASGYEDYIYNGAVHPRTRELQNIVHAQMSSLFSAFTNRGKKRANFHMVRESDMPAILPEFLFITNKKDADFLRSDSNLKKIGQALAVAIAKFLKLEAKKEQKASDKKVTERSPRIRTGGLNDANLIKVVNWLRDAGWYWTASASKGNNPVIRTGGLGSQKMIDRFGSFLDKEGMWWTIER